MEAGRRTTDTPKKRIFRFNPGIDGQLFPPKHPYYKLSKAEARQVEQAVGKMAQANRIEEMMAELPDNLTAEEKRAIAEHNVKLEEALGITKGRAMNYDEANKGRENPHFSKGGGYHVNCQTCTVTHWLRRLGFDVEAMPNIKNSAYIKMESRGITWKQRFLNLDGSDVDYDLTCQWQRRKGYGVMTSKRLNEYFTEKLNQDGLYEIYCGWKSGAAHVFCAEVKSGKVRYFDPQSGSDNVKDYLPHMKPGMVGVIRIDNKLVNPKLKDLFIVK